MNSRAKLVKGGVRSKPLLRQLHGRDNQLGIIRDILEPQLADLFKYCGIEGGADGIRRGGGILSLSCGHLGALGLVKTMNGRTTWLSRDEYAVVVGGV